MEPKRPAKKVDDAIMAGDVYGLAADARPTLKKKRSREGDEPELNNKQVYNIITDVAGGPNMRFRDNLFQGIAILVSVLLGVGIGVLVADYPTAGVVYGGFLGLVGGFLASGTFLMVYRAVQHIRGRHD
jgi:hypothetical protein